MTAYRLLAVAFAAVAVAQTTDFCFIDPTGQYIQCEAGSICVTADGGATSYCASEAALSSAGVSITGTINFSTALTSTIVSTVDIVSTVPAPPVYTSAEESSSSSSVAPPSYTTPAAPTYETPSSSPSPSPSSTKKVTSAAPYPLPSFSDVVSYPTATATGTVGPLPTTSGNPTAPPPYSPNSAAQYGFSFAAVAAGLLAAIVVV